MEKAAVEWKPVGWSWQVCLFHMYRNTQFWQEIKCISSPWMWWFDFWSSLQHRVMFFLCVLIPCPSVALFVLKAQAELQDSFLSQKPHQLLLPALPEIASDVLEDGAPGLGLAFPLLSTCLAGVMCWIMNIAHRYSCRGLYSWAMTWNFFVFFFFSGV